MTTFEKILNLQNSELDSIDLTFLDSYIEKYLKNTSYENYIQYFYGLSGQEHYRLLIYISSIIENEIIFDIGTNCTMSALALSFNKNNLVKSYDIMQKLPSNPEISNIKFIIGDSIKDQDILSSTFIFLDVDHDGIYEKIVYDFLLQNNWKGILMLDDIYLNDDMKKFWNGIPFKKFDLTNIGHWSGTGMVLFGQ